MSIFRDFSPIDSEILPKTQGFSRKLRFFFEKLKDFSKHPKNFGKNSIYRKIHSPVQYNVQNDKPELTSSVGKALFFSSKNCSPVHSHTKGGETMDIL